MSVRASSGIGRRADARAKSVGSWPMSPDGPKVGSVSLSPRGGIPLPGSRYDVQVTANQGSQTAESRITLFQRS